MNTDLEWWVGGEVMNGQRVTDMHYVMVSFSSSNSDFEFYMTLESDLQGSDDDKTQSERSISDSDEDYMPENDCEVRLQGKEMFLYFHI